METITLGLDAKGEKILLTPHMRADTHMHIVGGSGQGKSKFLEWMIRQDIRAGHGLCVIDWHGSLYNNLVRWCASRKISLLRDPRQLILLNVAHPDFILPFNPFAKSVSDITSRASDLTALILRAWGDTDTDSKPTFQYTCNAIFRFMLEHQEALPNAAQLLEFSNRGFLLDYALRHTTDSGTISFLRGLKDIKAPDKWKAEILATRNRFDRLTHYKSTKRFMGLTIEGIDIPKVMDEGAIVFINLAYSKLLPRDLAKVFAAFFLSEFFTAGMERAEAASRAGRDVPNRYLLYLDEFQKYVNEDMADMLDEVRKGGLHMVFAHQHMVQFADNHHLKESILVNARLRAVFGGLTTATACELAEEMCLSELNQRQVKKVNHHITHTYQEESRTIYSESEAESEMETESEMHGSGSADAEANGFGSGTAEVRAFMMPPGVGAEGWFETESTSASEFASQSASHAASEFAAYGSARGTGSAKQRGKTEVPVWVPIPVDELTEEDWTLEEKRFKLAEVLKYQAERHCMIKLNQEKTQPLCVPYVHMPRVSAELFEVYEKSICQKQGSLPAEEVDQLLIQSEQKFLERAQGKLHKTSEPIIINVTPAKDGDNTSTAAASAAPAAAPDTDDDEEVYYS